jgi:hypothetical protein
MRNECKILVGKLVIYADYGFLACNATWTFRKVRTLRRNIPSLSSGLKFGLGDLRPAQQGGPTDSFSSDILFCLITEVDSSFRNVVIW